MNVINYFCCGFGISDGVLHLADGVVIAACRCISVCISLSGFSLVISDFRYAVTG